MEVLHCGASGHLSNNTNADLWACKGSQFAWLPGLSEPCSVLHEKLWCFNFWGWTCANTWWDARLTKMLIWKPTRALLLWPSLLACSLVLVLLIIKLANKFAAPDILPFWFLFQRSIFSIPIGHICILCLFFVVPILLLLSAGSESKDRERLLFGSQFNVEVEKSLEVYNHMLLVGRYAYLAGPLSLTRMRERERTQDTFGRETKTIPLNMTAVIWLNLNAIEYNQFEYGKMPSIDQLYQHSLLRSGLIQHRYLKGLPEKLPYPKVKPTWSCALSQVAYAWDLLHLGLQCLLCQYGGHWAIGEGLTNYCEAIAASHH